MHLQSCCFAYSTYCLLMFSLSSPSWYLIKSLFTNCDVVQINDRCIYIYVYIGMGSVRLYKYISKCCFVSRRLSLSLSMNICAQRKAGGRKRAFLLPIVPCASSPVTRLSIRFSLASVRKTKLLHEEKAVSK